MSPIETPLAIYGGVLCVAYVLAVIGVSAWRDARDRHERNRAAAARKQAAQARMAQPQPQPPIPFYPTLWPRDYRDTRDPYDQEA